MEHNDEVISDFKGLINILNDGKEGYNSASEITEDQELKDLFLNFAVQRGLYADELKAHLLEHGGGSENESGGVLGVYTVPGLTSSKPLVARKIQLSLVLLKLARKQRLKNLRRLSMILQHMQIMLACSNGRLPAFVRPRAR